MKRFVVFIVPLLLVGIAGLCRAADADPKAVRALYDRVTPSLVVVQFTYDSELGRTELNTLGVVIDKDGLVMISMYAVPPSLPDSQLKDFKIMIPGDDETELEADFIGRDDRTSLAYVKSTKEHTWTPLKFEDVPVEIGDTVYSVGLLPKDAGYKSYIFTSRVSAQLRGPTPQVMVSGDGLGNVGAPVLNADGLAIGYVHYQPGVPAPWFDRVTGGGGRGGRGGGGNVSSLTAVMNPPKFFVPAKDFVFSQSDLPVAGKPMQIPNLGVAQMAGLNKAEAEYFDLKGQPAVQVGDVLPNFPADKAGLKPRDIIVKMNGQPLERGDEPDEAAAIMTRKVQRMKVGDTVTLSVMRQKGKALDEVAIKLEERPKQSNRAERFFAEDLGFTTREIVFADTYERRLPADTKGVVVALVKPSSSAQTGKLETGDLIVKLNQSAVEGVSQFKSQYESFRKDHPRDAVVMEVMRRGVSTEVVRIEPPQ